MDVRTRVTICRLLTFAWKDTTYSERCGIKDVSYYKSSCIKYEKAAVTENIKDRNKTEGAKWIEECGS